MGPKTGKSLLRFCTVGFTMALFLVSCSGDETFSIMNPAPSITSVSPEYAIVGNGPIDLSVQGLNFLDGSVVRWNGSNRTTTFHDSTRLTFMVSAADLANPHEALVQVFNPDPGGGASAIIKFPVYQSAPVPYINSIYPRSVLVGEPFVLQVQGEWFARQSVVRLNGRDRSTTFITSNKLLAEILADDVREAGIDTVTVFNPDPDSGTSNIGLLTVAQSNPAPNLASISPDSVYFDGTYGSSSLVTLHGTGFIADSEVLFDGRSKTTIFASVTELTLELSRWDLTRPGIWEVIVRNPAPGGGDSSALPFVIVNRIPHISSISPEAAETGTNSLTMKVEGTGFSTSSIVRWNGVDKPTTYSATDELRAEIGASDLEQLSTVEITVFNPPPGGGQSEPLPFALFTVLPLRANDLLYDPGRDRIYATVPSSGGAIGNSVVVLIPRTGEVESSVYVGGEPSELAMSADGHYLYVALDGPGHINRLVLDTMSSDLTFGLGMGSWGPLFAEDMVVPPEDRATVVVSRYMKGSDPRHGGVAAYRDGVKLPNETLEPTGANRIEPSGQPGRILGLYNETYQKRFYRLAVDASGVTVFDATSDFIGGTDIVYEGGRLFTTSGQVIDPVSVTLAGKFATGGSVCPVESLNKVFFVESRAYDYFVASVFDMSTFSLIGEIRLGQLLGMQPPRELVYPGDDFLVFRTYDKIFILEHPLVGAPAP